jgi:hypothetical protein
MFYDVFPRDHQSSRSQKALLCCLLLLTDSSMCCTEVSTSAVMSSSNCETEPVIDTVSTNSSSEYMCQCSTMPLTAHTTLSLVLMVSLHVHTSHVWMPGVRMSDNQVHQYQWAPTRTCGASCLCPAGGVWNLHGSRRAPPSLVYNGTEAGITCRITTTEATVLLNNPLREVWGVS